MTGRVRFLHGRSLRFAKSCIAAGLFQVGLVHAQQVVHGEAAPRPEAAASPVQSLPQVTVQGVSYGANAVSLPSTITVLGRRALTEGQPQVNLSESLAQVPGLIVNNRQDYAQDMQLSIRGFGADSPFGVQGIYMTLDGIPLTMPDGQGQSQIMNLPTLGGMKIIKGPFAALYGNAAGGVIQAYTRDAPEPPSLSLRTWMGEWGTRQTTLIGGGTSGDISGIAGLTDFRTNGWRDHSAATRRQFNGTLSWSAHGDDRFSLVFNALNQDAQDPGGLTRAQLQADPRQADAAVLQYDTRKSVRNRQTGLVWEHLFDADNTMRLSVYGGTRHIVQYLPFTGSFGKSAGGVVDLHDYFSGTTADFTHSGVLAARPYTLAAGLSYGSMNEYRKGYVNNFGAQGALRNDQYNTVNNFAQYVQGHWELTPRLSISGGVRHDAVRFNSAPGTDAPLSTGTGGAANYSSSDPVVGLLYKLDAHNRVYADYGHGFVTPTFYQLAYRPDGQPGLNFALQPMHLRNSEVGWRSQYGNLRFDGSLYYITTDNQIVVASSTGGRTTYANAGSTRRYGTDLSLDATLPAHFSARLAYSLIQVRFVGGAYNGNTLPGVPRQQFYAGLTWRPPLQSEALQGFYTTVSALVRSQVYVDAKNSAAAQGYGALNWVAGVEQRHGSWHVSEFVRVDNLLNRNYVAAVVIADTNGRYYEAAPGRNVIAGVQVTREF
jgi:iron complex outermembrane receptor protein